MFCLENYLKIHMNCCRFVREMQKSAAMSDFCENDDEVCRHPQVKAQHR